MSTNIIRIKRRLADGGPGAPSASQLVNAELAFSEADEVLYYGKGGDETSSGEVIVIGGKGAYMDKTSAQTLSGVKTFTDIIKVDAEPVDDNDVITKSFLSSELSAAGGNVTLTETLTSDLAVGGLSAGEVLPATTTLLEFAEKLLFKKYDPTFISPSVTLTTDLASVVESGTTGVNFTASYNAGSIKGALVGGVWDANSSAQGNRAGAATKYTIDGVDNGTNNTYNDTLEVIEDGAQTFSATVDYAISSIQPKNSKNEDFSSPLASGSVSDTVTVTGKRKAFYGYSSSELAVDVSDDIRGLSNSLLGAVDGSTFTLTMPAGTKSAVFAYPASLGNVTSVKYVQGFNSPVEDTFTKTTVNVEGANGYSAVSYNVYKVVFLNALAQTNTYTVTI